VSVSVGTDVNVCVCVYTHIEKQGATPGLLARCNCLLANCRPFLRIYRAFFADAQGSFWEIQRALLRMGRLTTFTGHFCKRAIHNSG